MIRKVHLSFRTENWWSDTGRAYWAQNEQ